jgi:chromate transporter
MERDLVERRRWLDKLQMRDVIAVCQTMPGPLAVRVAIFVGYLGCGFWGAWADGWALILPASTAGHGLCPLARPAVADRDHLWH